MSASKFKLLTWHFLLTTCFGMSFLVSWQILLMAVPAFSRSAKGCTSRTAPCAPAHEQRPTPKDLARNATCKRLVIHLPIIQARLEPLKELYPCTSRVS